MLRRFKAPTGGLSSCVNGFHRNKRFLASRSRSIHHVNINRHHPIWGIVRSNSKPRLSDSIPSNERSLTTTFNRTFLNHVPQVNLTSMSKLDEEGKEEEEEEGEGMDYPEGASLQDEEWLDATINNNDESFTKECETKQQLIMSLIEKEIPLLVQDYLFEVSSSAAAASNLARDLSLEGQRRHRHDSTNLAERYHKELKWIRKSMESVHLREHPGNETVQPTAVGGADEHADANPRTDSSLSIQDSADNEGGDDLYIDEDEDLSPWDAYLADSKHATNNVHYTAQRRRQEQQDQLDMPKMPKLLLLLHSCLALLRAMSRNDWAVVDDQSLLLTGDADDNDEEYATHESSFDPGQSFTSSNKGLQEKDDHDYNNINNETSLDDVDDELFWTLRQLKLGDVAVERIDDYNLVLARIALAAELNHDDILEALFDTLHQIKRAAAAKTSTVDVSGPNATTYEILLLIMIKRLGAFRSALDLVRRDMIHQTSSSSSSSSHLCTTTTLEAAIQLCEKSGDLDLARKLWRIAKSKNTARDAANDDDSKCNERIEVRRTNRAHHSMLNLFKAVDARGEAIESLRVSLQDNDREINSGLDRVFVNAINWPNRNRKGEPIDNLPVLVSILNILDKDALYRPDASVLKQLLISVSRGAEQENHARWKVVQRIFQRIVSSFSAFHVDEGVMGIGLEASEALLDSTLAAEMVTRMLDGEFGHGRIGLMMTQTNRFAQHEQSRKATNRLPSSRSILKAMDICVNCGDAASARRILDCAETHYDAAQIPKAIRQRLFVSTLKVCATVGQGQVAEQLLSTMLSKGLEPTEEAFGAVIHGHVLTKSAGKARGLWNDMKSGRFGSDIVPGPTSYNAIILDCIQSNSWSDALEIYEEMKKNGVVPLESTCVGLLLSSFKEGGRCKTMQFIDELVKTKVSVNADICMMALRLLIPDIAKNTEFVDMRNQLRSLSDKESVHALNRAIRSAELEEQREPSTGLPRGKINERRAAAWHEVLMHLAKSSHDLFPIEDGGEKLA